VRAANAEPVTKWERQSRHFQVVAALAPFPVAHSVYTLSPSIGTVAPLPLCSPSSDLAFGVQRIAF